MKKLKYLLLIFIIFLAPNVFAAEFNMNSYTSGTINGTRSRYDGTEMYLSGSGMATYQFGTRYNGRLTSIETYYHYPFEANTTYTLTYNMNTEDFRNNFSGKYWWDCDDTMSASNQHVGTFTYVSYKKIKFSFKPNENTTCIRVWLTSSDVYGSSYITGVNNWRLDSITLYDPDYQSGSSGGQGSSSPTPTPSGATNQDIINNQNDNTQDIINNQNDNTSDIIENNNSNTETLNESINDNCKNTKFVLSNELGNSNGNYLNTSGNQVSYNGANITRDIKLRPNTEYHLRKLTGGSTPSGMGFCLYNVNGALSRCLEYPNLDNFNLSFTPTNYEVYAKFTMYSYRVFELEGYICNDWEREGLQSVADSINETNQYLKDNSDPNIQDNDFMTMFNSVGVNDPLNYLLTLPTQLINKIVSLSGSCSPIDLGRLYGTMLTLPCINLENILGSTIWNIIDVIFSVSLLVVIFKNLYDTFSNLLTMGAEKEAKEKFSMPTPMDFLSMILGGDR